MATKRFSDQTGHDARFHNGNPSPREIEQDIERTRGEMDETIDELSERLNPRHLMDDVLDFFRSSTGSPGGREVADYAKSIGRQALHQAKEHPIPAMLFGAGLAWLLMEQGEEVRDRVQRHRRWDRLSDYSGTYGYGRGGEFYDEEEDFGGASSQEVAAWHTEYDWSTAEQDEQAWTQRADRSLDEIRVTLGDENRSALDRIKHTAAHVLATSGHKRRDIHSRWSDLHEHSGSFVDARTGQPYDASYGKEWRHLVACDYAAGRDWSQENEESWTEKAQHAISDMQSMLADTGSNVKQKLQTLSAKIGDFVGSTRDMSSGYGRGMRDRTSDYMHRARERAGDYGHRVRSGAGRMRRQIREGGTVARDQIKQGYVRSRDRANQAMDEYPLAIGAAILGLGILAGLALPRTRREDELMGETSDDLKQRAKEKGSEVAERSLHVAEATASAAMDEAEKQGLTPQQIGEKIRQVGSDVKHTVEDAASGRTHEQGTGGKIERVLERATQTAKAETQKQKEEMTS